MKTKFIRALGTLCVLLLMGTIGNAQVTIYSTDFGSVANVNPPGWTFTGVDMNVSTNNASTGYIGVSGGAYLGEGNSIAFTNTSGASIPSSQIGTSTATLLTSSLGYSNITISFGMRKSSAGYNSNVTYKLEWSADGINYNHIFYTEPTDGSWGLVSDAGLTLPSGAANQAKLYIKWTFDRTGTASNYKIDDFKVTGQIPQTIDYSFVVVGCNRVDYTDTSATTGTPLATGPSTANVYQLNRLFTEVSQLNPLPTYLFMAGDVVMGYINDTVALATQLRNWRNIYENHPLSQTGIKLVVVPGNHETQDKAAGKKSFVAAERTFVREMAPYIMGTNGPGIGGPDNLVTDQSKLTYSFNNGLDHFIVLDTDPVGKDGRVPYKWVASDIRNARLNGARHIFAIGHKPAYASHFTPLDGLEAHIDDRDSLWKHLENNQCEAMISAHNHVWDSVHPHVGKTWQVIAGNGGSRVESSWMGAGQSYFGFTLINIYKNNQVNLKSMGRDADMTKLSLNEDGNITTVRADFNLGISPVINHAPLTDKADRGPFVIQAEITDDIAVTSAQLNYSVNGVNQTPITPVISGNAYTFTIPAQSGIGIIKYNIQATDASSVNVYSNGSASSFTQFAYGTQSVSSSQTPYVVPFAPGVSFTSILTAGDVIGGYTMCGTPDGLGAFDNGNGTFTLLMNHEFGNTAGAVRAHGQKGAFVSKWVINKSDLSVVSGADLIQNVNLWNGTGYTMYNAANPSSLTAFNRFCSADLPAVSAYYNSVTGLGTQERIFMNGEETGPEGRIFGHIASGTNAGTSYELPRLGKFSSENLVANSFSADKTVVIGMDDSTPGQVYVYVGTKSNTGTEVDKAGLTNGKLFGVTVTGMATETNAGVPTRGTAFTLTDLGNVENMTGSAINTASNNAGITTFLRPEDGAWDPSSPNDFYFNTTNAITSPSRVWRLRFTDVKNPELGGTIEAVLDGTEGQIMLDNMTIDNSGHIILLEDVGNNAHNGKVWQYTIATDVLTEIGHHDPSRFETGGSNFLTIDEETSGVIDAQAILGEGMFLIVDQAHYAQPGQVVEGGQLLAFYNPETHDGNPEIAIEGNNFEISNNDTSPSTTDNTDFGLISIGSSLTKEFLIHNSGSGKLKINTITISGTNAEEFTLVNAPTLPLQIEAGSTQSVNVKFEPREEGPRVSTITINSNDLDESIYKFRLKAEASTPTGVTSSITSVQGIQLFPNPAGNQITVSVTMDKPEDAIISIYDLKGNRVGEVIERNLNVGINQVLINTIKLNNGTYNLQLLINNNIFTIKTIIIH